jgi:hypothetical protein
MNSQSNIEPLWWTFVWTIVLLAVCIGIAEPVEGRPVEREGTGEFAVYLPLIHSSRPVTHALPLTVTSVDSWGYDHAGAFAPDGSGVYGEGSADLVTAVDTSDLGQYYLLTRSYVEMEVPASITGTVVSARLEGPARASWFTDGDPLPAPTISVHLGTWGEGTFPDDRRVLWGSYGPVVGTLDTAPFFGEGATRVEIGIDPKVVRPGETLRLVLRDGEDHVDLRSHGATRYFQGDHPLEAWALVLEVRS